MIQSIIHSTENKNLYLYDDQHRLTILVHPELQKAHEKTTEVDPYYSNKYAYLKKHGFFTKPKLAEFRMLDESIVRDNIINTKQIVFEATDACNLSCKYCSLGELYEGFDKRNGKKMNIHYAINLLKYIFDIKPHNKSSKLYISFYGGEALLNINFIKKIVEVVSQLNIETKIKIEYSLTTNATLLDKHIDFLVSNEFRLLISLDGNEKNHSYRVFRKNKQNSFQNVINNIDLVQKNYPNFFQLM